MKKLFALILAIGLMISSGVGVVITAGSEYADIPQVVTPEGGNN